jgi:hypothetical protein
MLSVPHQTSFVEVSSLFNEAVLGFQTNPSLEVRYAAVGGWAPSTIKKYALSLQCLAREQEKMGSEVTWEHALAETCLKVLKLHQTGGSVKALLCAATAAFTLGLLPSKPPPPLMETSSLGGQG